jgi:EAL domain-containing protein (putative c-di-GMP-specific phosphodiesterase class I)
MSDDLDVNKCLSMNGFVAFVEDALKTVIPNQSVALMVMSLQRSDRMMAIMSETYNEQMQDAFTRQVVPMLRDKDRFCFVNENECWFCLPQLASEALAVLAVHRLLHALIDPLKVASHSIFFNPKIGIACAPEHGRTMLELLRLADTALKNTYASNLRFFLTEKPDPNKSVPTDLLQAVKNVLDANRLEMRFQPKVHMPTQSIRSAEALVRWPSDHEQNLATFVLIDIVEQFGLIDQLTMQVFNKVMQAHAKWRAEGLEITTWINLSARLLTQDDLPQVLSRLLQIWNVPAGSIGLEITESAFIHDIEHSTNLLLELREIGFHLSIDDFGTGYSSLAYLRRFPIDELKIDRMFVQGLINSEQDQQIVKSIVDLAHNFKLPVVAEGVEDEETLKALQALGCDEIQGFYFAKPMLAEELLPWCKNFTMP